MRGALVALLIAAGACGGAAGSEHPIATLSTSPAAGNAFSLIREAFEHDPHDAALAKRIAAFVAKYPNDRATPLARLYMGHVMLDMKDMAGARSTLIDVEEPPPGNTHDFWMALSARLMRLQNRADDAISVLQPLVGTTVDTALRSILLEEVALAAIDAHRSLEAIAYLDGWLRSVPPHAHKEAHERVRTELQRIEPQVVEQTLEAMQGEGEGGYSQELQKLVAETLAKHALDAGDTRLAQRLINSSLGKYLTGSTAGQELRDLATSLRGARAVVAHTIGVVLPTDTPELRDAAADAARGAAFALGLPRAAQAVDDGTHLVTRADASANLEPSLEELAGAGAGVVLAGFDEASAERACLWAEQNGLAVITLAAPRTPPKRFCFVAGEARLTSITLLVAELEKRVGAKKPPKVATITGAVAETAMTQTKSTTLDLLPPFRCEPPYSRERLPLADWSAHAVHDFLVSAPSGCMRTLLPALPITSTVGIALESLDEDTRAALRNHHAFGVTSAQNPNVDEYAQKFGAKPSYWTALGRDAALLAHGAVAALPNDRVTSASDVSHRRDLAREGLLTAKASLWTTDATTFGQDHTLPRSLRVIALP